MVDKRIKLRPQCARIALVPAHGNAWRGRKFDGGMITADGTLEHDIVRQFASRLSALADARDPRYGSVIFRSGTQQGRLSDALRRKCDLLIILRLYADPSLKSTGRVMWGGDPSAGLAASLGSHLGKGTSEEPEEGLLRFSPSVDVELANVCDPAQLAYLQSVEGAEAIAEALLLAVDDWRNPCKS